MRIYVGPPRSQIARDLFGPLAASLEQLGHEVSRGGEGAGTEAAIVWNGRDFDSRGRPLFCCENGWLPRSAYQIGLGGFNAAHHAAPWRWTGPLSEDESVDLAVYLGDLRNKATSGTYAYTDPTGEAVDPGEPFLLAPIQMPQDVNMESVPQGLRTPYSFARAVLDAAPPWRVIFKQHPMDANHGNDQLNLPGIDVWPHGRANVHQLLKSEHCRGVVTLNSNVAHDALLWGVPVIALGAGMWGGPLRFYADGFDPDGALLRPFWVGLCLTAASWQDFGAGRPDHAAIRNAYAHWLIRQQWTPAPRTNLERRLLRDASNPEHVAELLEVASG